MTGFTDVFGGSTVQPSNVAYASVALSASILTYWPPYVTGTQQPLARLMDVIAVSSGLTINLPDATLAGPGQDVFFNNPGSNTFTVQDSGGNVIATVSAGQQKYLYLSDNSTSNGTWRVTLFGVGASAPDASALVGYGLKAIGATLNQSATTSTISANTTFGVSDRAKVFVNTGGAITCTLPLTSTASNDFFLELRNQGTGTVTVAPIGGETVDGSASVVLQVNESCFLHAGTGAWYTVGRGRNTSFNFTQLLKTVTGGTTTLSLTEASNVVQTYSGTATSPNVIVIPSVVQVYYISNQVLGGFNFTIQSPTPGSTLVLPYGQNAVVFCDGVNVINASTSVAGITALLLAAGSVSTPSLAISASGNGLYAPTSSTIAVTAGGVASVTFSGNGVNGRLGGDTPAAAAVTTLSASGAVSGAGVTALMASPTPIGSTTPSTGAFTTLSASGNISLTADNTSKLILGRYSVAAVNAYMQPAGNYATIIADYLGAPISTFSSTGLAVTGAISASGSLTLSGVSANVLGGTSTDNAGFANNNGSAFMFAYGSAHATKPAWIEWATGSTGVRMSLDASGNLGLGVTPSAGSIGKAFEIALAGNSLWSNTVGGGAVIITSNSNYNSGWKYSRTAATSQYSQVGGAHSWLTAPSGTAGTAIPFTQAMTLTAAGDFLVGTAAGTGHRFARSSGAEATLIHLVGDGTSGWSVYTYRADSETFNNSDTCQKVAKNVTTSRSINAAGTINASGADYAEYEHNNGLAIAKGQIVGFKADGTLTDTFADAIRFGIKSTNPSYVGGDTWGSEEAVGKRPEAPQFVAPEYTGSQEYPGQEPAAPVAPAEEADAEAQAAFEQALAAYSIALVAYESARHMYAMDQSEHTARVEVAQALFDNATMPEYQRALAVFDATLEAERQKVDRIAYSGKVPCNVTGAVPGGYIIAMATDDGFIAGQFVPDPDFAQYRKAVGRVNRILPDGRCEVAVMVH